MEFYSQIRNTSDLYDHVIKQLQKGTSIERYSKHLFMQFLLNAIAFYYNIPVFYKISRINQYEYYAEPTDKNMKCFNLKKYAGTWIAEGGYTDWQASQIGEQIDRLTVDAIRN